LHVTWRMRRRGRRRGPGFDEPSETRVSSEWRTDAETVVRIHRVSMAVREWQGNKTNATASRHSGAKPKAFVFFFRWRGRGRQSLLLQPTKGNGRGMDNKNDTNSLTRSTQRTLNSERTTTTRYHANIALVPIDPQPSESVFIVTARTTTTSFVCFVFTTKAVTVVFGFLLLLFFLPSFSLVFFSFLLSFVRSLPRYSTHRIGNSTHNTRTNNEKEASRKATTSDLTRRPKIQKKNETKARKRALKLIERLRRLMLTSPPRPLQSSRSCNGRGEVDWNRRTDTRKQERQPSRVPLETLKRPKIQKSAAAVSVWGADPHWLVTGRRLSVALVRLGHRLSQRFSSLSFLRVKWADEQLLWRRPYWPIYVSLYSSCLFLVPSLRDALINTQANNAEKRPARSVSPDAPSATVCFCLVPKTCTRTHTHTDSLTHALSLFPSTSYFAKPIWADPTRAEKVE